MARADFRRATRILRKGAAPGRARQLAGRTLGERQLALAARRNEMAAERVERLDQQVTLLLKDSGVTYHAAVVIVGVLMIVYVVFGPFVIFEFAVLRLIRNRIAHGGDVPVLRRYFSVLIETSLPFATWSPTFPLRGTVGRVCR